MSGEGVDDLVCVDVSVHVDVLAVVGVGGAYCAVGGEGGAALAGDGLVDEKGRWGEQSRVVAEEGLAMFVLGGWEESLELFRGGVLLGFFVAVHWVVGDV